MSFKIVKRNKERLLQNTLWTTEDEKCLSPNLILCALCNLIQTSVGASKQYWGPSVQDYQ